MVKYVKYLKYNIVNFNDNSLKRIYHLPKLVHQVTVKICIYIQFQTLIMPL
jgi:hypothetical protein